MNSGNTTRPAGAVDDEAARKAFEALRKRLRAFGYILDHAERTNGRQMLSAVRRDECRLFADLDACARFADAIGAPG